MAGAHSDFRRCNRSDGYVIVSEDVCLGRGAKFHLDALSHPETAQRMVVLLPETTLLAHRGLYPIIPTFLFTS